ncbi:MAG: hypothetical protein JSW73_04790 [Candidatus Woesearchaeota archaeon]|nr:MAG: hypothetical protein JSW73_04790 [Candidatus Woesearchaeota archaeon]
MGIFRKIREEDKVIVREGLERLASINFDKETIKFIFENYFKSKEYKDLIKVNMDEINCVSTYSKNDFPEIDLPLKGKINVNEIHNLERDSYKVALNVCGPYPILLDIDMDRKERILEKEGSETRKIITRELESFNEYNVYCLKGKSDTSNTIGIVVWKPDKKTFDSDWGFCKKVFLKDAYLIK